MSRRAAFVFSSGLLVLAVACSAAPVATSVVAKRTPRPPTELAPTTSASLGAGVGFCGTWASCRDWLLDEMKGES